ALFSDVLHAFQNLFGDFENLQRWSAQGWKFNGNANYTLNFLLFKVDSLLKFAMSSRIELLLF
ncbi:MAG: hypothetical protein MR709_09515, partial [Bacteroidales bacterium]|nr:hypothetical protein [Bacteroidales bacterium]